MAIDIYYQPSLYETKFLESAIQNALEQDARLDSTAPQDQNPILPRVPVKLIHLIDPADATKPLKLPHYKPINLTIRLDRLSVSSTNLDGTRTRFLSCSNTLPQDIFTLAGPQSELPLWSTKTWPSSAIQEIHNSLSRHLRWTTDHLWFFFKQVLEYNNE